MQEVITMDDAVFREYDIRGKVDSQLPINQMYDLTRTIAYYFQQRNPAVKKVAVGIDGRTHSPAISNEVCRALLDAGIDVAYFGLCPSPVLYFGMHTQPIDAGIMVTASHNPKEYNGLKILLGTATVWGQQIAAIRQLFKEGKQIPLASHKGQLTQVPINDYYLDWLEEQFNHLKGMSLSCVIDCGHATAAVIIPPLIERMGWRNMHLLCAHVDGTYPSHEADPTVAENMEDVRALLQTTDAVCGIGFDGDADRMGIMTKDGTLVPGDTLLAFFAKSILKDHPDLAVVADIKSSEYFLTVLKQWGAHPSLSPSGHAIVKTEMKKRNALLAGELSCHFFFADRFFGYDDAIYAMMRFLEIVHEQGMASLKTLHTIFPPLFTTREYRIAYQPAYKDAILEAVYQAFKDRTDVRILTIDGMRVVLPDGWFIIRSSNTQPVMCFRFESDSERGLVRLKKEIIAIITPYMSRELLEHEFAC